MKKKLSENPRMIDLVDNIEGYKDIYFDEVNIGFVEASGKDAEKTRKLIVNILTAIFEKKFNPKDFDDAFLASVPWSFEEIRDTNDNPMYLIVDRHHNDVYFSYLPKTTRGIIAAADRIARVIKKRRRESKA